MNKVIFYTKAGCHLCEEAERMLLALAREMPLEIESIDISAAAEPILRTYFDKIPVVARPGLATELNWPFTMEALRTYLERGIEE